MYLCSMEANVTLSNLTIGYPHHTVQQQLNGTIRAGRLTCVVGENGCGKSTLLRTLAGFLKPQSGCIKVGGASVSRLTVSQLSRLISVVLTTRPNTDSLTVEEVVAMGRAPYTDCWGRLTADDRELTARALQTTGISALRQRKCGNLSDGELQKTMIAKALAQQTPLILLDEPTAFLDFPSKVLIMRLLAQLAHDEGKTILLSTHDVTLAARLADDIWMMRKHQGWQSITREELKAYIESI